MIGVLLVRVFSFVQNIISVEVGASLDPFGFLLVFSGSRGREACLIEINPKITSSIKRIKICDHNKL